MKKFLYIIAVLAFMVACSSDSDGNKPNGQNTPVVTQGNDQRPAWQAPNYRNYEQTMTVCLYLQEELLPYISSEDLLCAIIDNEVRGVATVEQEGEQPWVTLIIAGNGTDESIALSYYCDQLHRIFTIPDWCFFDATAIPSGTAKLYTPQFLR